MAVDISFRDVKQVEHRRTVHIGAKGRIYTDVYTIHFADGSKQTLNMWPVKNGAPIMIKEEAGAETVID